MFSAHYRTHLNTKPCTIGNRSESDLRSSCKESPLYKKYNFFPRVWEMFLQECFIFFATQHDCHAGKPQLNKSLSTLFSTPLGSRSDAPRQFSNNTSTFHANFARGEDKTLEGSGTASDHKILWPGCPYSACAYIKISQAHVSAPGSAKFMDESFSCSFFGVFLFELFSGGREQLGKCCDENYWMN